MTIIVLMQVREGGSRTKTRHQKVYAFRADEGRGKSLKKIAGVIFSFFSCPSARTCHPYCCER